jgi:electron transport complex protein RnfC
MNAAHPAGIWPLPGGIHPPENKQQSLQEAIRRPDLPRQLIIPLTQPGFAKPEVLVVPGAQVLKGQVLARGTPTMGITCHASTSGTVTALVEHAVPNASGLPEPCALLEPDGQDTWLHMQALPDWQQLDTGTLLARINEAGISGLGGAGFPAHTKLRGALDKVHTLIINACECEPFITADAALMREQAASIITGIAILLHITGAPQCLIGIEDNKPEAIAAMQAAIDDPRIRVVAVPTKYPSGAEKQLVWILTGSEIPSGSITIQSGILCHNVGTAHALTRAVLHGEALVSRITTLTGAALRRPGNLDVLIGTPVADLLRECDVDTAHLHRLINGGPLMGVHLAHADLPVLKITNCIIATTLQELPPPAPQQACIRCGYCAEVCPVSLLPQQLYWFARGKELAKANEHNLFDCIECGACAWVCPSHIPLVQYYRAAKAEIRDDRAKHRMAEHSKQRYEFHQARKAAEKAQEEQRRAERAALARQKKDKSGTEAQAAIAAALARVQAKKAAAEADKTSEEPATPAADKEPDA